MKKLLALVVAAGGAVAYFRRNELSSDAEKAQKAAKSAADKARDAATKLQESRANGSTEAEPADADVVVDLTDSGMAATGAAPESATQPPAEDPTAG